jgi:peptidyl-prolyl cis-trans isomerase SurA
LLALGVAGLYALAPTPEAVARAKHQATAPSAEAPAPAGPVGEVRIAAVVNDEVISVYDLISRIRMVTASSNLPDTPETRKRIAAQILRAIVDEKLQMQEAKRQNVTATDEEVKKAEAQIEKQNNMQPGQLDTFLRARGIDKSALIDQLTASIVWSKLVRRLAAQTNEVSDEEIDDALKRLKEHANEPQSRVAEIFLAVDNPAQDEDVRHSAERLSDQMKHGARFSAIAQQFSQSATAAVGGDIGWVRPDQLSPELGKVVAQLKPGELSEPIRTGGGYYLILVLDRRNGSSGGGASGGSGSGSGSGSGKAEEVLDVVQVVFPLPASATEAMKRSALAEAESVRNTAKSCPQMLQIGKEKAPQLSSEGHVRISEVSPAMRKFVLGLEIGQPSKPILQRNGIGVLMVCGKSNMSNTSTAASTKEPSRDDVAEMLLRQRLDGLARRYMRDLRRAAFVDVRVAG